MHVYLLLQIQMMYKKRQRTYYLYSPRRSRLVKCIGRGRPSSVARFCLSHPLYFNSIVLRLGNLVKAELKGMRKEAVSSILTSADPDDILKFSWDDVIEEAKENTPVLYSILHTAVSNPEKDYMVGFLIATLCNLHWRNMNLHMKVIACILYAGQSSKQVSV